jgi:cytochrome c5
MSGARLSFGVVAATFVILGAAVARADELPPGPNREVVARECQACHDANYFESTNRSRESWDGLIDEMISYGMRTTPEERAKILDYLATALGPRPN